MAKVPPHPWLVHGFPERCPQCGEKYQWRLTRNSVWCSGIFHHCRDCVFNKHHVRVKICSRCKTDPQRGNPATWVSGAKSPDDDPNQGETPCPDCGGKGYIDTTNECGDERCFSAWVVCPTCRAKKREEEQGR